MWLVTLISSYLSPFEEKRPSGKQQACSNHQVRHSNEYYLHALFDSSCYVDKHLRQYFQDTKCKIFYFVWYCEFYLLWRFSTYLWYLSRCLTEFLMVYMGESCLWTKLYSVNTGRHCIFLSLHKGWREFLFTLSFLSGMPLWWYVIQI